VEVKKNIYDLSLNRYDTILGVVENTGVYDGVDESTVRLYDVGRRRDDDDDVVSFRRSCVVYLALTMRLLFFFRALIEGTVPAKVLSS
jgi:hypothetical protein